MKSIRKITDKAVVALVLLISAMTFASGRGF